ncbi:MAG TPA: oligosaccharide flippase family protein, partial [Candidatus Saccharimonadales bacterium]|nr:oligosaccharide flippase family protein [Candidatus Saccharimonadales bacterium]
MAYKKIRSLTSTGDKNFIELLQHSFWAIVILGLTTGLQFLFDFVLARKYEAHGTGVFYLCFTVLMTLALFGRLGLDQAVVRFIPPLLDKDPEKAAGVNSSSIKLSLYMTIPLAVLLFVLSPLLAEDLFHSPELTTYLRIFSLALPALSLNYVVAGVLRALKRSKESLVIARMSMYGLGIVGIFTLGTVYGLKGVVIGFAISIYISTLLGFYFVRKHLTGHTHVVPFSKKQLLIISGPLLFVIFATQMSGQASVLLLGVFSTNADVGIFNIALKISMLMNLILAAINVFAATKISELYFSKQKEELNIFIGKISALGTLLGLPLFIIISLFSTFWLGLFGHTFEAGSSALIILAAGQLVNVSVGSTSYILA